MIRQIAIIGVSRFSKYMIEELLDHNCELLVLDRDESRLEPYKNRVALPIIADAINEEVINNFIPRNIDGAVVDFGTSIEVSFLVTNYLKKMGIHNIIVRADTEQQAEILEILGARQVVLPHRAAAKRMAPMIIADSFKNYFPLDDRLIMVEVRVPKKIMSLSLQEADLRNTYKINIIAIRRNKELIQTIPLDYQFNAEEDILIVGDMDSIGKFTSTKIKEKPRGLKSIFG